MIDDQSRDQQIDDHGMVQRASPSFCELPCQISTSDQSVALGSTMVLGEFGG